MSYFNAGLGKWESLYVDGTTAGTTSLACANLIDLSGYDSVAIIATLGAVVATGCALLQPKWSDVDSATGLGGSTSAAFCAGSTAGTTDISYQTIVADLHNVPARYASAAFIKGTANVTVREIVAFAYNQFGSKMSAGVETTTPYGCFEAKIISEHSTS